MDVDEDLDQILDLLPHRICQHVNLKYNFATGLKISCAGPFLLFFLLVLHMNYYIV